MFQDVIPENIDVTTQFITPVVLSPVTRTETAPMVRQRFQFTLVFASSHVSASIPGINIRAIPQIATKVTSNAGTHVPRTQKTSISIITASVFFSEALSGPFCLS